MYSVPKISAIKGTLEFLDFKRPVRLLPVHEELVLLHPFHATFLCAEQAHLA